MVNLHGQNALAMRWPDGTRSAVTVCMTQVDTNREHVMLNEQRNRLTVIDQQLAKAAQQIMDQCQLIQGMRSQALDTRHKEDLLLVMLQSEELVRIHRKSIEQQIVASLKASSN